MTSPAHSAEGSRNQTLRARQARREEANALGVDDTFVSDLVENFYASIRADDLLGPIFAERIGSWPEHLDRMKAFWRSILFNSGEFSGNPMLKHMAIPGLEERHFARWLTLFYAALRDLEGDPRATPLVAERARSIADSLLTGISIRHDGLAGSSAGRDLPHV